MLMESELSGFSTNKTSSSGKTTSWVNDIQMSLVTTQLQLMEGLLVVCEDSTIYWSAETSRGLSCGIFGRVSYRHGKHGLYRHHSIFGQYSDEHPKTWLHQ